MPRRSRKGSSTTSARKARQASPVPTKLVADGTDLRTAQTLLRCLERLQPGAALGLVRWWRLAMYLPGRLPNAHRNCRRVFLIFVAAPRTAGWCTNRFRSRRAQFGINSMSGERLEPVRTAARHRGRRRRRLVTARSTANHVVCEYLSPVFLDILDHPWNIPRRAPTSIRRRSRVANSARRPA
jgi:hypothetical protein